MRSLLRLAGVIAALLALGSGPAPAAFERGLEKTLGKQARDAVESQYQVVSDDAAARYVERVGAALVEVSPRHDVAYTFKILDTEQVNAFALPFGYVYVTTGMLRFVDSSDELAGVLGHEIAHVAEKHSLDAFKQQFWASLLFGVIDAPATLLTLGQVGTTLYFLRYSRKDEQAADRLGTGYAYAAGFDPARLATFLRKLDQQQGHKLSTIEVYLATHPSGERRQERLAELPEMSRKSPEVAGRVADGLLARHLANQAVVEYRRAIALAPDRATAYSGLARAYADLGEAGLARGAEPALSLPKAFQRANVTEPALSQPKGWNPVPLVPGALPGDENQAKLLRAAAAEWRQKLQDPTRQIKDRAKSLDKQVHDLAQRMSMNDAFGRPTATSERITDKAQLALYLIADTSDRVGAAGDGLEAVATGLDGIIEAAAGGLAVAGSPDRGRWLALTDQIAVRLSKDDQQAAGVRQHALQAAELAAKAASQLSSAMGSLGGFGSFARGLALMGLAEGELDDAVRSASAARDASVKAMAMLGAMRATDLSWRLSVAYLNTPPAHRAAMRSMAAAMIAADPQKLEPTGVEGFGEVLVRASAAAAATSEAASSDKATPAPKGASASASQTNNGGDSAFSDLMLKLVLADVTREAEARKQWQGAPESPGAGGSAATPNP